MGIIIDFAAKRRARLKEQRAHLEFDQTGEAGLQGFMTLQDLDAMLRFQSRQQRQDRMINGLKGGAVFLGLTGVLAVWLCLFLTHDL